MSTDYYRPSKTRLTAKGEAILWGALLIGMFLLGVGWHYVVPDPKPDVTCTVNHDRPLPAYTVACPGFEQSDREVLDTDSWLDGGHDRVGAWSK